MTTGPVPIDDNVGASHNIETTPGVGGAERQVVVAVVSGPGIPATLGQTTMGSSAPVTIASNQTYPTLQVQQFGTWASSISTLPGAYPTTDAMTTYPGIGKAYVDNGAGHTALTKKYKTVSVAASQTDSVVVAAVTSKKIVVLEIYVHVGGTATDLTFESDGGSDTTLWVLTPGINGGGQRTSDSGVFETLAGEALIVTTSGGSTSKISLSYVEV